MKRLLRFSYLLFVIALSFHVEAFAHEYRDFSHSPDLDINAEHVGVGDTDSIRKMALHMTKHIELIQDSVLSQPDQAKELVILGQRTRELGVFNNGKVYSILVNPEGYIANHGLYPDLHFKKYFSSFELKDRGGATTGTMQTLLESKDLTCVDYHYDGQDRTVCAMGTEVFSAGGAVVNIIGFHHAKDDYSLIEKDNPNCNDPLYSLPVTAKQVNEEQDLESKEKLLVEYVKAVADRFKKRTGGITLQMSHEDPALFSLATGRVQGSTPEQVQSAQRKLEERSIQIALKTTGCLGSGDYKEGSIYPFMFAPEDGTAVINGLDFHRYGLSTSLTDPEPIQCDGGNILEAFVNAATRGTGDLAQLEEGNNGFVTYHWKDPARTDDANENYLEKLEVPGFSIKKSYIEVIDATPPQLAALGAPPLWRVVGSGIYLDDAEYCKENEGGCTIAETTGTPLGALLNLFVIVSVFLPAVFWRFGRS